MTLNEKITWLKEQLKILNNKLLDLSKNTEEKLNKPYSKVKKQLQLGNQDLVFDGNEGIWKNYAIYKDDEEQTGTGA